VTVWNPWGTALFAFAIVSSSLGFRMWRDHALAAKGITGSIQSSDMAEGPIEVANLLSRVRVR